MAKGQKRSTKEAKKPKANKPAPTATASTLLGKGVPSAANSPKGKS